MSDDQKFTFPGKQLEVEWDGRLCIHIAECGRSKGELFVGGRQPWCQPDLVEADVIVDVVERCPTGALSYKVKQADAGETAEEANTVTVSYNGPYFIRGDLAIEDATEDMPGVAFRAALCRCGHSKNKPFCDNSHEDARFQDYGAVGEKGEVLSSRGGKLVIKSLDDGPLMLKGNLSIVAGSGRSAWTGTKVALCRCGASENKPFCDGSHVAAGFKSKD